MRLLLVPLFLTSICGVGFGQSFKIDSLPQQGILLDKGWKWHAGDNPDYAKADFDDSKWESIDPTLVIPELKSTVSNQPLWLRLKFKSSSKKNNFFISVKQSGATEIYLNNHIIHAFGIIDTANDKIKSYDPNGSYIFLPVDSTENIVAIKYYFEKGAQYKSVFDVRYPLFSARIFSEKAVLESDNNKNTFIWEGFNIGFPLILFVVHFIIFLFYMPFRANLWYSLWALFSFIGAYFLLQIKIEHNIILKNDYSLYAAILSGLGNLSLIYSLFLLLRQNNKRLLSIFFVITILSIFSFLSNSNLNYIIDFSFSFIFVLLVIYMAHSAYKQGNIGGKYVIYSMVLYLITWILFIFSFDIFLNSEWISDILFHIAMFCLPITMSILLGIDFRNIHKNFIDVTLEKQQILTTQNETLEKQVQERTTELELKNRDLEIEAALERVRAKSLEMYRSDELKDVVATLYEQLQNLDFQYGAASIIIMDERTKNSVQWVGGFNQSEYPVGYNIEYFNHPAYEAQFTAWKNGDKYIELVLAGEEKMAFDEYMFTQTDFKNFPEEGKAFMQSLTSVVFSLAYLKHGALQWGPEKLNNEQAKILQKFAVVFEQAYTRFLDLKQAEAQAREGRIEVVLEKIRSRTMAMHNSDELNALIGFIYSECFKLDMNLDRCLIMTFDKDTNDSRWWVAGPEAPDNPINCLVKYHEYAPSLAILKGWHNREQKWSYILEGDNKKSWDAYAFEETELVELPDAMKSGMRFYESIILNASFHNFGCIMLASLEPLIEEHFDLLVRLSKVFDLSYTRFLDLRKAEAQAREAQIEVALERVRSRTMAMQYSGELAEAANLLSQEVRKLGIPIWSCGYNIMEKDEKACLGWMSTEGSIQPSFRIPLKGSPTFIKFYESRQHGEILFEEKIGGADLEMHYNYMLTLDGFSDILKDFISSGYQLPTFQVNTVVNFTHGNLIFISAQPVPEAHDIFKRFATVFEQTYTRFLDLKLAEAQAEQAHLDLIQIQTEKKRAEDALIELRITQTQLIQKEKMASLGELTAGIAHEIQNPLNFVNNYSEVNVELMEEMEGEMNNGNYSEAKELLTDLRDNESKIHHHGRRADAIVRGMLEHARTTPGERQPTDLNRLADEYLRLAYQGLRRSEGRTPGDSAKDSDFQCELVTDFDPNLGEVEVVAPDIGRVLLNLYNNAFYAVQQKRVVADQTYMPTVWVSTRRLDKAVEIRVRDNGAGIPEAIREKIFQPFFTTKPTGEGTGLGLSLSYDIVTKGHGGELRVESKEGEGTDSSG